MTVSTNSVPAYKAQLAQQRPVGLSIPVYDSWYRSEEARRSGRITMRVGNEPQVGGHAVLLVGYQDEKATPGGGFFLVRNHWSTQWAYQSSYGPGYGVIPYAYIQNYAWEAFTLAPTAAPVEEQQEERVIKSATTVSIQVGRSVRITIDNP